MLDRGRPAVTPNWDQDETAVAGPCTAQQDPATVGRSSLTPRGRRIAGRFEARSGDQWRRTGNRSDGARFTVESFARYFVHDPVHHLYDVTGQRAVQT